MAAKQGKSKESGGILIAAENRKARHDYQILDTFEAGVVLTGPEVKAVREGTMNLKESYVRVRRGEVYLIGCHISPYKLSRAEEQNPTRERKLLMHRREIERLLIDSTKKGLTILALKAYFKNGRCKIEVALGRGKKMHDKRDDAKKKQAEKDIARAMRV